jgi:predicted transposase/invertase (TIGR01784 family)
MRFLDLRTDFAFKKVFGSEGSKDILLSFLNAVLEFGGGRRIADLTIVDPYNIPMLKGIKDTFVDVKAVLDDHSRVIIEMQVLSHEGFEKRVLYNAAKNYSVQLVQGQRYHLLNPVIALTLTDFRMFDDELLRHAFKLIEKEQFIHYSDDIELIFYELPKFTKGLHQLETLQDKWLWFIQNAGALDYVPDDLEAELAKAFGIANEANMTVEELEIQHKKQEWIYIQKMSIELAHRQGVEQGMEQGLQQGMEQGRKAREIEMVLNAHAKGLPVEMIQGVTGLDRKEIERVLAASRID